jgi:DNA end-binding protein Ku
VRDGVLTLEQMYFADEVKALDDIRPARKNVDRRELELAQQLIDSFSGTFEPEKYKDTYRDALCKVIEDKRKGRKTHVAADREEEEIPDLMEALRLSLKGAKRSGKRSGGLESKTKAELMRLAQKADIAGRSQMGKEELVEALEAA